MRSKRAANLKVLNALLSGRPEAAKKLHKKLRPLVGLDYHFSIEENRLAEPQEYANYQKYLEDEKNGKIVFPPLRPGRIIRTVYLDLSGPTYTYEVA